MTTLILLAGGIGSRMNTEIPKQFIKVNKIPIIIHTLLNFQKNKNINKILIVCVKDWINDMWQLVKQYKLNKVKWIIEGGNTGHDSTRNGMFYLKDKLNKEDFVVIHDSARPIVPQKIINDMVKVAKEKGNASVSLPCYETLLLTNNQLFGTEQLDRSKVRRIQTPQMYKYSSLLDCYEKAEKDNKHDFTYANTLSVYYKKPIYFSKGFSNNIKITTKEDISLFKSLLKFKEDDLINK